MLRAVAAVVTDTAAITAAITAVAAGLLVSPVAA
jgi:hypothetical protein